MTPSTILLPLCVLLVSCVSLNGFSIGSVASVRSATVLFSESRQPRRNLKKRRNRRQKNEPQVGDGENDFPWETAESRPLIPSTAIEAGEDYWIDDKDLEKAQTREQAVQNRKALEGEIPKEKLWQETLAPYKQNWIGFFSIGIVVLITLITQFPELLEAPTPQIPDL
mmetsp:Transcript_31107/g.51378  ORF Transcript_31107/g.51378 Transcript_31107/m.51378 type:complete len:168 (-) Transcript_31107:84-587(-)|eukprot:CAMPEP_0119021194 /NCGR_PEP_ID=MMETSP1176-20130426/25510_1 /TAXON_ID=265551 /ORGANISM="Synedropsis recta cf, Strain CCMP1620" /LENGTH=167 /DNA_ID=CAMNT_0006975753 /DNA_START=47 /DNA_END=550 /DNA_ORIENTATION=+